MRVARIFNTYGPKMDPDDGRVVSNFIKQALRGEQLTIYGDGKQTRSFQYVSDLVQGLIALMNCDEIDALEPEGVLPINIGNPEEYTIKEVSGRGSQPGGGGSAQQHDDACSHHDHYASDGVRVQFAEKIRDIISPGATIIHEPASKDDPKQRRPNITRAASVLHWAPKTRVDAGLERTIAYFKHELGCATAADAAPPAVWMPDTITDKLPADYCAGAPTGVESIRPVGGSGSAVGGYTA